MLWHVLEILWFVIEVMSLVVKIFLLAVKILLFKLAVEVLSVLAHHRPQGDAVSRFDHPVLMSQTLRNNPPSSSFFSNAHNFTVMNSQLISVAGNLVRLPSENRQTTRHPDFPDLEPYSLKYINLRIEIYNGESYRIHRGDARGTPVLVKVFEGPDAKKSCMKMAESHRNIMHPNVLQLIGGPDRKSRSDYLVFGGDYWRTAESALAMALKDGIDEGCIFGFNTVIACSLGLDYLQMSKVPFPVVRPEDFVLLVSTEGRIVLSFDTEVTRDATNSGGKSIEICYELIQTTFYTGCKEYYRKKRSYADENDVPLADQFPGDGYESDELEDNTRQHPPERKDKTGSPTHESHQDPQGHRRKFRQKATGKGHRRELIWKSQSANLSSLGEIGRKYQTLLANFHSDKLVYRQASSTAQINHRCLGYKRTEIILSPDIKRSGIVSHASPVPNEICSVCGKVVQISYGPVHVPIPEIKGQQVPVQDEYDKPSTALPIPLNSIVAHNDSRQPSNIPWRNSLTDYPMDVSPQEAHHPNPFTNGHIHDASMIQDRHHPPPSDSQDSAHVQASHGNKLGKFMKKNNKWGLSMFGGDKSHHNPLLPLPPVDEMSPAINFPSRKRAQSSSGTNSKSVREPSPVKEPVMDDRTAKKAQSLNKKEAECLLREAEMAKRELERAREVLAKRQQVLGPSASQMPHDAMDRKTYFFVALPGNAVKKRPRRRYDEIERCYLCSWPECNKSYGTLNHLNAHVTMQKHGPKRSPNEFKELRKQWRRAKKDQEASVVASHDTCISPLNGITLGSCPSALLHQDEQLPTALKPCCSQWCREWLASQWDKQTNDGASVAMV